MDILFNHINNMDDHIKFTMQCPDNEGSISFLDTKCLQNSNHTIHSTVYRKPIHMDRYLDWNSNHPISAKWSVIQAITNRAKIVCSTPELLAKEIHYLNKVLCRKSYLYWFIKKPNHRPHMDQPNNQETTKESFILSKVSLLQNKYFLSMTSFCCLQVSFIRSCGKCSPHKVVIKNIILYNPI